MTEEEARRWLTDVPRETLIGLNRFIDALTSENERQNLISATTIGSVWGRHIVDSAQLLKYSRSGSWLDLGSGAGFPGLVVAAIAKRPVTLVECRKRRADFLRSAARILNITELADIIDRRLEVIPPRPVDVISARAFAPLDRLFAIAAPFATPDTVWLLPKGRGAMAELEAARRSWQGDFRIVPSVTDPESAIIVASNVGKRR